MQAITSVVETPRQKKLSLVVEPEQCKGCGYCVAFCPKGALTLSDDQFNAKGYYYAHLREPDQCVACGLCAMYCPDFAIYLLDEEDEAVVSTPETNPTGGAVQ